MNKEYAIMVQQLDDYNDYELSAAVADFCLAHVEGFSYNNFMDDVGFPEQDSECAS